MLKNGKVAKIWVTLFSRSTCYNSKFLGIMIWGRGGGGLGVGREGEGWEWNALKGVSVLEKHF